MSWEYPVKLPLGECHKTSLMITLAQVMAWCRQATSHYLSQCWLKSVWPYDVNRPQWVNLITDTHLLPTHPIYRMFIMGLYNTNTLRPDKMATIWQMAFSFFLMKGILFWFEFHWYLLSRVHQTMNQLWYRYWLGTKQVTSHYLKQWWHILLMHIFVIWPQWAKTQNAMRFGQISSHNFNDIFWSTSIIWGHWSRET